MTIRILAASRTCRSLAILAGCLLAGAAVAAAADDGQPVLLFGLGIHIEPLGRTAQGYTAGQGDYWNDTYFRRHVEDLRTLAAIVERHGGRMTVQAQSPFTQVAIAKGEALLAELAARGHEIGLHFHEDAHLGHNSGTLSTATWCQVMADEIALVKQAGGVATVRYWSGGNLYPGVFQAASCAGLSVNSDWKNPRTQEFPAAVRSLHPWRPAGGTDGVEFSAFVTHDPQGPVVFLPEGAYTVANVKEGGDYLAVVTDALHNSLAQLDPERVNVMHFTLHPGELRGDPAAPFAAVEAFLATVVDPLVAAGSVRWATLGEMADAYIAWERGIGGASRPAIRRRLHPATAPSQGYITFAVNVHDWVHPDESAATLSRLMDIFERYRVRGDFYFTPEITRVLAERHPELVERFRRSSMTVSYHVRAPHPLVGGFGAPLAGLTGGELYARIRDYETYALDLETGALDRSRHGGYLYVAETFGRKPVVASAPSGDPVLRSGGQQVYRDLGAQATVIYHETGTDIDNPLVFVNGLLVRPSDFSVTRTTVVDGGDNFWWNFMSRPDAGLYRPLRILELELEQWRAAGSPRLPFITALIHENNFVRSGPEGWTSIYYEIENGKKSTPLPPPWNLDAPDPSTLRPTAEQEAIWHAYEELVAWAAANLTVVTSEDLVELAYRQQDGFDGEKAGTVERNVVTCSPAGTQQAMDVYYPASAGPWPAVVFVHGGGWTAGDKAQVPPEVAALQAEGFLVASVNYRLAPAHPFPAQIEDVACAVRFLRAHAATFNLDPARVGAMGSSAGGHLVGLLGTSDPSSGWAVGEYLEQSGRVQAVADFFGPADLTVPFAGNLVSNNAIFGGVDPAEASPVTHATPDDPPFLLVHGRNDTLVPLSQSELLLAALQEQGVPAELLVVENAGHGLTPAGGAPTPSRQQVVEQVVAFFRSALQARP